MSDLQASTKVVGTYYYEAEKLFDSKQLGRGGVVNLRRDPVNAYDKNAIMVLHQSGSMVGHVPKRYASVLAPKMDMGLKVSANVKEIGRKDGKLHVSLNLTYANIPRASPKTQNVVLKQPVKSMPRPTPTTTHRSTPEPIKPTPPSSSSAQNQKPAENHREPENGSFSWWIWGLVLIVALVLISGFN